MASPHTQDRGLSSQLRDEPGQRWAVLALPLVMWAPKPKRWLTSCHPLPPSYPRGPRRGLEHLPVLSELDLSPGPCTFPSPTTALAPGVCWALSALCSLPATSRDSWGLPIRGLQGHMVP